MKNRIIDLFTLFGYRYDGEKPEMRLLFFDCDYEQEIQLWLSRPVESVENLAAAVNLITKRIFEQGKNSGKSEVIMGVKKILELK